MRKVLSLILVACMLLGGMVFTSSAYSSATATILDDGNVSVDIYYFGGEVNVDDTAGTVGKIQHTGEWNFKEGDPSKGVIRLDGVIEDGEWGDPIVVVDSAYAANNMSATGGLISAAANALYETPSAENTYFYMRPKQGAFQGEAPDHLKYTLYMMWDEDYVYVAAHVEDPDGQQCSGSGPDLWDGDCFQFRLDPNGANSVVAEKGLDHYDASRIDSYHYNADGKIDAEYKTFPWAGTQRVNSVEMYSPIPNFMFGYTAAGTGETDAYDAAPRYDRTETPILDADGNETGEVSVKYFGQELFGLVEGSYWEDNYAAAVSYPINKGTAKNPDWVNDYEIAIPWEMLSEADDFLASIGAGKEIGASFTLLNGARGTGVYNSYLEWGSGVCGSRTQDDSQTCGGSNAIILSDTPYTTARCDHDFSEATCIAAETCTKCGYTRGYPSGHEYVFSDVVAPTSTENGSITGTCSVCGYTYTKVVEAYGDCRDLHSFVTTDTTLVNKGFGPSGWTNAWYDSDEQAIDDKGNVYKAGNQLFNPDGTSKNSFDTKTFGYAVADCATVGSDLVYIDGTPATMSTSPDFDCSDQTGTYFDADSIGALSYSYKADFYFPTIYGFNRNAKDYYTAGIYNWFGGKQAYKFMAGLFVFEKTQQAFFAIAETDLCGQVPEDVEYFKSHCLAYKEVTGTKYIDTNTWHEMVFLFDNASCTAFLYWDDELQVAANDYHFELAGRRDALPLLRRMNVPFYAKDMHISTISYGVENFLQLSDTSAYTVTVDGVATQYNVGDTVELNKAFYVEDDLGHRFISWDGDTDVLADVTAGVTSFVMPAKDVVLNSKYVVVGDLNGDGNINAIDSNIMKKINAGAADEVAAADINKDGNINAIDASLMLKILLGSYIPEK